MVPVERITSNHQSTQQAESTPKFLDYRTYGFTDADLDKEFWLHADVNTLPVRTLQKPYP